MECVWADFPSTEGGDQEEDARQPTCETDNGEGGELIAYISRLIASDCGLSSLSPSLKEGSRIQDYNRGRGR